MTVLKTHYADPFSGGWCDWFAPDGSVSLTFKTMHHQLWETWKRHCRYSTDRSDKEGVHMVFGDFVVDHSQFDPDELLSPGIHAEFNYDDPEYKDEIYDIIIPDAYMPREACEGWIERLNNDYDREFKLVHED